MKTILSLSLLLILSVACGKNDKRIKEQAKKEGEAINEVDNQNLARKAEAMEQDLTRRHRFYQAIKGTYEGTIDTKSGTYNIRVILSPSLSPLRINRVRQLEEIASDLNNLKLNTQIVQWDPNSLNSAVGCRIGGIGPNIEKGEITISDENCSNLYQIQISDRGTGRPSALASDVLAGHLNEIDTLVGKIHPSTNAAVFNFTAHKVNE